MSEEALKKWIDYATYKQLLRKWRFALSGDPLFQGDVGDYFKKVMFNKQGRLSTEERVRISKEIGWSQPPTGLE